MDWVWATSAYNPIPADGAEDVARDANLAWTPGNWADDTDGHHVYFGTDCDAVRDATTTSDPCGVYQGPRTTTNKGFGSLTPGMTYCWRIDEVNDNAWAPSGSPWKGNVPA